MDTFFQLIHFLIQNLYSFSLELLYLKSRGQDYVNAYKIGKEDNKCFISILSYSFLVSVLCVFIHAFGLTVLASAVTILPFIYIDSFS